MASFVPYQIDYSVQNSAKTLGFSKKKVLFKFGFANDNSLRQGQTGPACRGSEHELLFIWSLASGKRQLYLDNKDVHYSESGQNGWTTDRAWQHAFTLRDSGGGTYRIHFVTQPVTRENPSARPFDLRIAGISYFRFNHIYQLGTPEMIVGHQQIRSKQGSVNRGGSLEDAMLPEERQQLALAKLESLKDMRTKEEIAQQAAPKTEPPSMQRVEVSLIDFDTDTNNPPQQQQHAPGGAPQYSGNLSGPPQQSSSYGGFNASSMTMDSSFDPSRGSFPGTSFSGAPNTSQSSQLSDGYYGATSNNPYAPLQPSSQPSVSNSYFGGSTANPYAPPSQSSNPYQQHEVPPATASMALTPYEGSGGIPNPSPYVDSTGRLSMGQPPPPSIPAPYGLSGQSPSYSAGYNAGLASYSANPYDPTNSSNNLASPSNQSYGTQPSMSSQFSYGSAPSFAQPPQQQQYQYSTQQPPAPQPHGYNPYAPNSYGSSFSGY